MVKAFHSHLVARLESGRHSFCQRRQFVALLLFHLRSKRAKIILRRVVPPLVSVLIAIVGSRVMTYVIGVMKEERLEKTC